MPNYTKIIKGLELDELETYAQEVLASIDPDELGDYAPSDANVTGLTEDELRSLVADDLGVSEKRPGDGSTRPKADRNTLVDFLTSQPDAFAEAWDAQHDDGDSMHPDETDNEFFDHEDPDKD